MPSKYQFGEMIIKLEELVDLYKNTDYRYNVNKLYLSDGNVLNFSFAKENIPHLLGINIVNLRTSKVLTATTPFEMLEELISRYNAIYDKMVRGELNYRDIFSPFIEDKIKSFEKALTFKLEDIFFTCNYSKERSYVNGMEYNFGCQYYVCLKGENDDLIFLGLNKKEYERCYSPSSLLGCFDKQKGSKMIEDMITNQQIMLVNCVEIVNLKKTNYLDNKIKLQLAKVLINLSNRYGSSLIITKDYIFALSKLITAYEKENKMKNFILDFISAISKGKKLKTDTTFDSDIKDLTRLYNDELQRRRQSDLEELRNLRKEVIALKRQLEKVKVKK